MFAWWPRKQSPPIPYQHAASAVSRGSAPETALWRAEEGTVPQAGTSARRLPLENRPGHAGHAETPESSPRSAAAPSPATNPAPESSPVTSQQRLEFLRYLIGRGIVNEGFEDDHPG